LTLLIDLVQIFDWIKIASRWGVLCQEGHVAFWLFAGHWIDAALPENCDRMWRWRQRFLREFTMTTEG